MPPQNPSTSKQDYGTPPDFLAAVAARFGELDVDLACDAFNAKAPIGLAWPETDSLSVPWADRFPDSNMWLNPPFRHLEPWAEKCGVEGAKLRRGRIILLTPASVGANWFAEHVHRHALVLALSPRLTFVGCDQPYPKDCMLSIFGGGVSGFECWRWSTPKVRAKVAA